MMESAGGNCQVVFVCKRARWLLDDMQESGEDVKSGKLL